MIVLIYYMKAFDPHSTDKYFLPDVRKKSINLIKSAKSRAANQKVLNVERIMPLFMQIGYLHVGSWFETVQNLPGDVRLRTSCIERWVCRILSTKLKVVHWQSVPVFIITTRTTTNLKYAVIPVFSLDSN